MADIVVFGAGQLAELAKAHIDRHGPDRVVGFTVDSDYLDSDTVHGLPLVRWEELESRFPAAEVKLLGPISFRRMNAFRRERTAEGVRRGYEFASFIHPSSQIYAESIGSNCFVLENNLIQPCARIGDGLLMGSGNHVGHHTVVGDFCFISNGVTISGGCSIGQDCYLAPSATIDMGVEIGAGSYIGSATLTRRSIPELSVVRPRESPLAPFNATRLTKLV